MGKDEDAKLPPIPGHFVGVRGVGSKSSIYSPAQVVESFQLIPLNRHYFVQWMKESYSRAFIILFEFYRERTSANAIHILRKCFITRPSLSLSLHAPHHFSGPD